MNNLVEISTDNGKTWSPHKKADKSLALFARRDDAREFLRQARRQARDGETFQIAPVSDTRASMMLRRAVVRR